MTRIGTQDAEANQQVLSRRAAAVRSLGREPQVKATPKTFEPRRGDRGDGRPSGAHPLIAYANPGLPPQATNGRPIRG